MMRAVVQRVKESSVTVDNEIVGKIGKGLLVLLGVSTNDKAENADYLAKKIVNLRIFVEDLCLIGIWIVIYGDITIRLLKLLI